MCGTLAAPQTILNLEGVPWPPIRLEAKVATRAHNTSHNMPSSAPMTTTPIK